MCRVNKALKWDQKLSDQQMAFSRSQLEWSVSVTVDGLDVRAFPDQEMDDENVTLSEIIFMLKLDFSGPDIHFDTFW